jgi:CheY-like chemotaxis protein/Tfp pilus assembly protein PilZ
MPRPNKILLVDDNRNFITRITYLLRKMGYNKVIIADNGIEALKLLNIWTPDIVILDVSMPEMDGITTLRHIKEDKQTSDLPVIMVSEASERKGKRIDCKKLGCSGHLTKPLAVPKLHRTLQKCLAKGGLNKRGNIRTLFESNVTVIHGGTKETHRAVSLSEGGIYIKNNTPLPVKTEVEVVIPLKENTPLSLKGTVIYTKKPNGNDQGMPPGMAVQFNNVSGGNLRVLGKYIAKLISS